MISSTEFVGHTRLQCTTKSIAMVQFTNEELLAEMRKGMSLEQAKESMIRKKLKEQDIEV
jgi:hypothetical protein